MKALQDWWLPLAAVADVADGACLSAMHFEQPVVLWRGAGGIAAFDDRCPHRGARLSLGRVQGGALECPYHGWRFGADGHCITIPAVPGFKPSPQQAATAWRVRELHGLLWVAGAGAPEAEPQAPPVLDALPRKRVLCGPFDVATSAPRVVENFLDTAHFGLVHEGLLGTREHLEVPDYTVQADALGRPGVPHYRAWQPQASSAATGGAWVDYRYQLLSPLSALLQKQAAQGATEGAHGVEGAQGVDDEAYVLWTCPTGRESCRAWFTIATADEAADDEVLRGFQEQIFAQDKPIVESQRPRELPLSGGEAHSAADRLSAGYRRWLRDIGFGHGCC